MTPEMSVPRQKTEERGFALLLTLMMILGTVGLALAVGVYSVNSLVSAKSELLDQQALHLAEAGWQRARQAVSDGTWSLATAPGSVQTESFGPGKYKVTLLDNGDNTATITSEGYVPDQTATVSKRQVVEATASVTNNGTNLSLSATASASSSKGGNTPDKANDGATNTSWEANTNGSNEWLRMDYGSATTLIQIIVRENKNIDGLTIESSSNGTTGWTTVSGLTVTESPAKTWTADFTSTSEQYFRAKFTSVPSNQKAKVKELESFFGFSITLGQGTYRTQW